MNQVLEMENVLQKAVKDNVFDEEKLKLARICYATLMVGKNDYRKIAKMAKVSFPILDDDFTRYIQNLKESDYFDEKGNVRPIFEEGADDIPFLLMMSVAEGKLKAYFVPTKKKKAKV
jgi:hypothetical protein